MVLYPLSAFRAMNKAAETVYKSILAEGDQRGGHHANPYGAVRLPELPQL